MTSLNKFKQRLRGETVKVERPQEIKPELVKELIAEEAVVVEEAVTEEIEQVSDVAAVEEAVEEPLEVSKLESMTKIEIDGYAAGHGIQLDRRQSKFNMITEFIQKIEEKN